MNKRKKGSQYEDKTKIYMEESGMTIIDKNYFCRFGEIDLVAWDDGVLVFTEVKYRTNDRYGHPAEHVHFHKQQTIRQVSRWYVMDKKIFNRNVRYDVAAWHKGRLFYYKGAF